MKFTCYHNTNHVFSKYLHGQDQVSKLLGQIRSLHEDAATRKMFCNASLIWSHLEYKICEFCGDYPSKVGAVGVGVSMLALHAGDRGSSPGHNTN